MLSHIEANISTKNWLQLSGRVSSRVSEPQWSIHRLALPASDHLFSIWELLPPTLPSAFQKIFSHHTFSSTTLTSRCLRRMCQALKVRQILLGCGWARLAGLSLKNGLITTGWRVILIVYCLLKPGILQISPQHHVLIRGKSASTWTYFTVSESRSVNKIIIEIEKMCLNVRSWRSRHSICCA